MTSGFTNEFVLPLTALSLFSLKKSKVYVCIKNSSMYVFNHWFIKTISFEWLPLSFANFWRLQSSIVMVTDHEKFVFRHLLLLCAFPLSTFQWLIFIFQMWTFCKLYKTIFVLISLQSKKKLIEAARAIATEACTIHQFAKVIVAHAKDEQWVHSWILFQVLNIKFVQ